MRKKWTNLTYKFNVADFYGGTGAYSGAKGKGNGVREGSGASGCKVDSNDKSHDAGEEMNDGECNSEDRRIGEGGGHSRA